MSSDPQNISLSFNKTLLGILLAIALYAMVNYAMFIL